MGGRGSPRSDSTTCNSDTNHVQCPGNTGNSPAPSTVRGLADQIARRCRLVFPCEPFSATTCRPRGVSDVAGRKKQRRNPHRDGFRLVISSPSRVNCSTTTGHWPCWPLTAPRNSAAGSVFRECVSGSQWSNSFVATALWDGHSDWPAGSRPILSVPSTRGYEPRWKRAWL